MFDSVKKVVQHNLCTGCGICQDICPTNSISIKLKDGIYLPNINNDTCISNNGCSKCIKVCPGVGIELHKFENKLFSNITHDKFAGNYINIYSGYSNTKEIRYHSASGGILSQFLIYLLEKKIIQGAVVTGYSENDQITPKSYIAKTKEEILNAKSSKYCPVSLYNVGNEIKNSKGKYIIVGLPCHIQGFRKRAEIDKKFKENVFGYFAIYCSSNRTFNARDYLFKINNIDKDKILYFSFRDEGCLGNMVIKGREKKRLSNYPKQVKIPFIQYYPKLRSFFKPRRCLTCIDHYGMLADVSFGDIHIKPYSDDKVGISSWIVRTEKFNKLFQQAKEEGFISMNTIDAHSLNESQKTMLYPKKRKAQAVMNYNWFLGKKIPKYDIIINDKPKTKDYLSVLTTNLQRFIGSHKSLWFLISLINSRK